MTQTTQGATSQGPATTDPHRAAEAASMAGPWRAVMADQYGFVIDPTALDDYDEDSTAEVFIAVVRGSAMPTGEPGDERLPGSWDPDDVLYRVDDIDGDGEAEHAEGHWARARAVAAALSAGLPATPGDDVRRLMALAERYRLAMHGQHASIAHLLDPCDECQRAIDECDGSLACAEQRGRDAEYRAALTPAEATPLATPEREAGTEHVEYAVQANFADATGKPWTSSPAWSRREQAKRQLTEWRDNDDNEPGLVLHVVQRTVLTGAWRTADSEEEHETVPTAGEGQ